MTDETAAETAILDIHGGLFDQRTTQKHVLVVRSTGSGKAALIARELRKRIESVPELTGPVTTGSHEPWYRRFAR